MVVFDAVILATCASIRSGRPAPRILCHLRLTTLPYTVLYY